MGFFTERCPNCGKALSKNAEFCNACGCPAAESWSTCHNCGSSVGGDSKFCWKCGTEQSTTDIQKFYGDRWHRSPLEFAARVELSVPEKTLHRGLEIEEGTTAVVFQDGKRIGTLEPGYHQFHSLLDRLKGFRPGHHAHAILLDTRSADVDFQLEGIPVAGHIPVDVRLRLLFQVQDPKAFVDAFFVSGTSVDTVDLSQSFTGPVREALSALLHEQPVDELMSSVSVRETIESHLLDAIRPTLDRYGMQATGLALAEFGGPAITQAREKLGEIARLNRELEINRRLNEAVRQEKLESFRDEEQLKDYYEQVAHELGLEQATREAEKKRFLASIDQEDRIEAIRRDFAARGEEIRQQLDQEVSRRQLELEQLRHELEKESIRGEHDLQQQGKRFEVGQHQQVRQAETDLEIAKQGVEALKAVNQAKLEKKMKEEALETEIERERLAMRGEASLQSLLATLEGEQADRLLKLAEIEMRRGLEPEQALSLVAEKSPELAPAVAEALKAKYSAGSPPANPDA